MPLLPSRRPPRRSLWKCSRTTLGTWWQRASGPRRLRERTGPEGGSLWSLGEGKSSLTPGRRFPHQRGRERRRRPCRYLWRSYSQRAQSSVIVDGRTKRAEHLFFLSKHLILPLSVQVATPQFQELLVSCRRQTLSSSTRRQLRPTLEDWFISKSNCRGVEP